MMLTNHTDIAWLAGVIDGEGCMSLTRIKGKNAFRFAFFLDNSSQPMLAKAERILTELGAVVNRHTPRAATRGPLSRVPIQRLHCGRGLGGVFRAVLPYMATEKKDFMAALLQLDAMRTVRYAPWTPEQIAFAHEIRRRFMPRSLTLG
jgi:hypothetical protein